MRSSPDADEELMRKIAQGDIRVFETLVEKHQKSLINVIYRFVGDRAEAEDLAQEVFIRVYRSAKRYKPQGRFLTWLYRIAKNLCLNDRTYAVERAGVNYSDFMLGGSVVNAPKGGELDSIHFLVAAQQVFTTTEAARIRAGEPKAPAHDASTRLLERIPPDTEALWREVSPFVQRDRGVLVVDDTTRDKEATRWRPMLFHVDEIMCAPEQQHRQNEKDGRQLGGDEACRADPC